jgi:hypothetical protein
VNDPILFALAVVGAIVNTYFAITGPRVRVNYHQFFVLRPTVGRLTYLFQDGRASQAVRLVRGFNVIQLQRSDKPSGLDLP